MKSITGILAAIVISVAVLVGTARQVVAEETAPGNTGTKPQPDTARTEQVKFDSHGLKLAGTIVIPKAPVGRKLPAVLLISGSNHQGPGLAPIARAPIRAFTDLASLLSGRGFVVFSYEARCNGASECRAESTPHDYSADAASAFNFLSRRKEVDAGRVIALGHDEGGTFAAALAAQVSAQPTKLLGLILVGAPGRTYNKVIRDQAQRRLTQQGKTAAEISAYLGKLDSLGNSLASGMIDPRIAKDDPNDPLIKHLITGRHYFFHLFVNDPLQVTRGIEVPVLIIQGEKDAHIGVKDAQYIKESMDRQHHPDVTLEVLPSMDHWMRTQTAVVFSDEEPTAGPLDRGFVAVLSAWLAKRVTSL